MFEKNSELSDINEDPIVEKIFLNRRQSFQQDLPLNFEENLKSCSFDVLPPEPLIKAPENISGLNILQNLTQELEQNDSGVNSSCINYESLENLKEKNLENSLVQHKRSASDHVVVSASTSIDTTCSLELSKCDLVNKVI